MRVNYSLSRIMRACTSSAFFLQIYLHIYEKSSTFVALLHIFMIKLTINNLSIMGSHVIQRDFHKKCTNVLDFQYYVRIPYQFTDVVRFLEQEFTIPSTTVQYLADSICCCLQLSGTYDFHHFAHYDPITRRWFSRKVTMMIRHDGNFIDFYWRVAKSNLMVEVY